MAMKPHRKKRLLHILGGLAAVALITYLVIYAVNENMDAFKTPTQILTSNISTQQGIRIGGLVKKGSVRRIAHDDASLETRFLVTDTKNEIEVTYNKVLPDLFREGQGIVALGKINSQGVFVARRVLAKHDEEYKAPEVLDALEQAGHPVNKQTD